MNHTPMRDHAVSVFHRPPGNYNCAQAVLDAFQTTTGKHIAAIADYKPYGGGRAPDNECGALYAACQAAPASAAALRDKFAQTAGSIRCLQLKGTLRFPCADCVGLAADLLQRHTPPEDNPRP